MPTDDYGTDLLDGDRVRMIVGIPGREVIATVSQRRGRWSVTNDEGSMSLAAARQYFCVEVIR